MGGHHCQLLLVWMFGAEHRQLRLSSGLCVWCWELKPESGTVHSTTELSCPHCPEKFGLGVGWGGGLAHVDNGTCRASLGT